VIRMMFENSHYIQSAIEGLQPKKCGNLYLTLRARP
jgi:hypothetical protein